MKFDINQHRDFFIAADTDSAIFTIEPFLIQKYGADYQNQVTDEEILVFTKQYLEKYSQKLNKVYLNNLSKDKFNITKHKFDWKTENIIKSALWCGKRRYAQYIIEKEGVRVQEEEYRGLELMKSNMNPIFKKFGENMVKNILFDKPKLQIDKDITDFYKSLKEMIPRELGKPTGVKNIVSYISRKPSSGNIFSETVVGAPFNAKAAIRYNDLLKLKKLDKKFEGIIDGDKIFVIDLKPNAYGIETLGIPNGTIPEEIDVFIKEYIDIESIFESMLLNKLKGFYSDLGWEFPSLNPKISKFYKFL